MPRMAQLILALLLGLALLTWAASSVVQTTARGWFERDVCSSDLLEWRPQGSSKTAHRPGARRARNGRGRLRCQLQAADQHPRIPGRLQLLDRGGPGSRGRSGRKHCRRPAGMEQRRHPAHGPRPYQRHAHLEGTRSGFRHPAARPELYWTPRSRGANFPHRCLRHPGRHGFCRAHVRSQMGTLRLEPGGSPPAAQRRAKGPGISAHSQRRAGTGRPHCQRAGGCSRSVDRGTPETKLEPASARRENCHPGKPRTVHQIGVRELVGRIANEREDAPGQWTAARLKQSLNRHLHGERIVILANREPYIHQHTADGGIEAQHPASGLVTALEPVMRACSGVWVAHGSGDADRETVDSHDRVSVPPGENAYQIRRVWLSEEEEQGYYYRSEE